MPIYFTLILSFFNLVSMHTGRVLITLYALKLGAEPFVVGAVSGIFSVLPTLLSWHAGKFADRFGSRWPLLVGTTAGALGMLVSYAVPGLPALFVTSVLFGLLVAFCAAPLQNLMGLLSGPENSARNFSNLSLVFSFGSLAGPLLAGFSLDHAGPKGACLTLVLLLLVPAMMLVIWGGILPRGIRAQKPMGSVRVLLSESGLWRVLATSGLVILGLELFQVFLPIYGHEIGLSASAIGIILALNAVAAFVVRIFLPFLTRRFGVERVLAYSFLIGAAGFILVPFFKGIMMLSLISFFFGLGMGCGQPITLMMTFSNSAQGRSGESMGLRLTVNHLTRLVGQSFFGFLGSALGLFAVFLVNALLLASGWAVSRPRGASRRHEKS